MVTSMYERFESICKPLNICKKEVRPVRSPSVPIRMKKAGSASIENRASRLAPIPSKLLPVSSAAIMQKNLPSART